jgi:hypothetical protein
MKTQEYETKLHMMDNTIKTESVCVCVCVCVKISVYGS